MGHRTAGGGSTTLGELVLYERQRRSLTRRELAELVRKIDRTLGTNAKAIERWELRRQIPVPVALRALAAALEQPVERLVALSRQARALGNLVDEEDETETKRREFLTAMVAVTGMGMIDFERLAAPTVDPLYLEEGEAVSLTLAAQRSKVSAGSLLPAALGHLNSLEARLPATTALTAQTALLTGSLLIKDGRLPLAYRCYSTAEALGDTVVRGKALVGRASVHARQGDTVRALALQDHAVVTLHGASPRAQAGVLARRAELYAEAGNDAAAMRDLEAAERAIAIDGYRWYYLSPEHHSEIGAYVGSVLLKLGRYREAVVALDRTLQEMDPGAVNWRAVVAADRDRAHAEL